jgi:hypothetical protein
MRWEWSSVESSLKKWRRVSKELRRVEWRRVEFKGDVCRVEWRRISKALRRVEWVQSSLKEMRRVEWRRAEFKGDVSRGVASNFNGVESSGVASSFKGVASSGMASSGVEYSLVKSTRVEYLPLKHSIRFGSVGQRRSLVIRLIVCSNNVPIQTSQ